MEITHHAGPCVSRSLHSRSKEWIWRQNSHLSKPHRESAPIAVGDLILLCLFGPAVIISAALWEARIFCAKANNRFGLVRCNCLRLVTCPQPHVAHHVYSITLKQHVLNTVLGGQISDQGARSVESLAYHRIYKELTVFNVRSDFHDNLRSRSTFPHPCQPDDEGLHIAIGAHLLRFGMPLTCLWCQRTAAHGRLRHLLPVRERPKRCFRAAVFPSIGFAARDPRLSPKPVTCVLAAKPDSCKQLKVCKVGKHS